MSRPLLALCAALAVVAAGCGGGETADEGPGPVEAPTELVVAGDELLLSTYAWQDQMPTVGDEPGPCSSLCVNGTIEVASGEPLPEDVEVLEVVAIVDGEEHAFEELDVQGRLPSTYEFVVRRGPSLEPGTTFDLAVRLGVADGERWLRAPHVTVERTV